MSRQPLSTRAPKTPDKPLLKKDWRSSLPRQTFLRINLPPPPIISLEMERPPRLFQSNKNLSPSEAQSSTVGSRTEAMPSVSGFFMMPLALFKTSALSQSTPRDCERAKVSSCEPLSKPCEARTTPPSAITILIAEAPRSIISAVPKSCLKTARAKEKTSISNAEIFKPAFSKIFLYFEIVSLGTAAKITVRNFLLPEPIDVADCSFPPGGKVHQSIVTSLIGMGIYLRASYGTDSFISSSPISGMSMVVKKLSFKGMETTASLAFTCASAKRSFKASASFVSTNLTDLPTAPSPYLAKASSPYVSKTARSLSFFNWASFMEEEPMSTPKNRLSLFKKAEAFFQLNLSNNDFSSIAHNSSI